MGAGFGSFYAVPLGRQIRSKAILLVTSSLQFAKFLTISATLQNPSFLRLIEYGQKGGFWDIVLSKDPRHILYYLLNLDVTD